MADGVDFWSPTIQAFAPLQLPAPELSEKILKRPPFRFIHDLVAAINARFAAYDHVIPENMLDVKSIDSKDDKIAYLKILIDYVGSLFKIQIDVNPKKIVSGHEPEKTNVFLQYLAAGVGLAQQDKATKEAAKAAAAQAGHAQDDGAGASQHEEPRPAEPEAPPANPADYGLPDLPHRDSLPRKKSSSASLSTARLQAKAAAMDASKKFDTKLASYSLNLETDKTQTMAERGQSIVQMWKDLQEPKTETTQSKMPAESLEMAIQRQIEQLKQLNELLTENEQVADSLENLLV